MRPKDRELFLAFIKSSGNTCSSLAIKVGCTRQMISALARGEKSCSPDLALKITAALDVVDDQGRLAPNLIFLTAKSRIPVRPSPSMRPRKAA